MKTYHLIVCSPFRCIPIWLANNQKEAFTRVYNYMKERGLFCHWKIYEEPGR